jgi:hypothetical protein
LRRLAVQVKSAVQRRRFPRYANARTLGRTEPHTPLERPTIMAARPQNNQIQTNALVLIGVGLWVSVLLFGGVLFLLTNEAQWYGLGLIAMLTTFVLVPARRRS